jgi:hypothetical protein
MEFNILKCKIMHLSPHNLRHEFSIGRTELSETQEVKKSGKIPIFLQKDFYMIVNEYNRVSLFPVRVESNFVVYYS